MTEAKPDCYCLGGDKAHYSEAKYRAATEEAKNLRGECLMLADVLRDAFEVIKTVEGEEQDECDKLTGLCLSIAHALALFDDERIKAANVQADLTGAASCDRSGRAAGSAAG